MLELSEPLDIFGAELEVEDAGRCVYAPREAHLCVNEASATGRRPDARSPCWNADVAARWRATSGTSSFQVPVESRDGAYSGRGSKRSVSRLTTA